jgi:hypothetical protein
VELHFLFLEMFLPCQSYFISFTDFVYPDFNETTGIVFNGDAGTTVCWDDPTVSPDTSYSDGSLQLFIFFYFNVFGLAVAVW